MKLKKNDVIARLTDNDDVKKYCVIKKVNDITYLKSYPYGENCYIFNNVFGYGTTDNPIYTEKEILADVDKVTHWFPVPVFFYTKSILCNPNIMSSREHRNPAIRLYRSVEQSFYSTLLLKDTIRKTGIWRPFLYIKYSMMVFSAKQKMKKYRKVLDIV